MVMATLDTIITLSMVVVAGAATCRERLQQPFASDSIWNTAVGSQAHYIPANLYPAPTSPPPPPLSMCQLGLQDPARRRGCTGWQPSWGEQQCIHAGCCYDPHPNPDPHHYAWCYANTSEPTGKNPAQFYVDQDYMIAASESDPTTPFIDQGWWGSDAQCGRNHCCIKGQQKGTLPFPFNWTINMTSNNAAALLLPDRTTLVQFQPLVRCTAGSPVLGLHFFFNIHPNISILSLIHI